MIKKITTVILSISFFTVISCSQEPKEEMTTEMEETTEQAAQLRHVVLFKFKEESTAEEVQKIEQAFVNLPNEISEIQSIEWGTNNSPEGLNEGLTHCFFLTFNSEEDRDAYLPHPAHKAFGELLGPHLDKVTVVDYWVKD